MKGNTKAKSRDWEKFEYRLSCWRQSSLLLLHKDGKAGSWGWKGEARRLHIRLQELQAELQVGVSKQKCTNSGLVFGRYQIQDVGKGGAGLLKKDLCNNKIKNGVMVSHDLLIKRQRARKVQSHGLELQTPLCLIHFKLSMWYWAAMAVAYPGPWTCSSQELIVAASGRVLEGLRLLLPWV